MATIENSNVQRVIAPTYRKNGWTYVLVERKGKYAIYEQKGVTRSWWEVVRIVILKDRVFRGKLIPGGEFLPPDSAWGQLGWTVDSLSRAQQLLNEKAA